MARLLEIFLHIYQEDQKTIANCKKRYKIEPFAKLRFSFKIKACEKFYHRHMIDIPRIKFRA